MLLSDPSDSSSSLTVLLDDVMISPTVPPSFERCDVLAALVFMGEGTGTVSRAELMKELNLKEGPIKTLLRRLEQNKLVSRIGNKGHILTQEGRRVNRKIREHIVDHKQVKAPSISLSESAYGMQLRGVAAQIETGIEQRDQALLVGATGATTLIFKDNALKIPSVSDRVIDKKTLKGLLQEFNVEDEDILIVGTGQDPSDAQRGAFNAALSLLLRIVK
jgi:DNA-binding MarR family transcriptional regulator